MRNTIFIIAGANVGNAAVVSRIVTRSRKPEIVNYGWAGAGGLGNDSVTASEQNAISGRRFERPEGWKRFLATSLDKNRSVWVRIYTGALHKSG